MYLAHYGLNQPPFGITPDPDFFYSGNQRGAILDALVYAVLHGEGIIKVTGEVGSGKTMLCRMLENRLPPNVVVIYLVNPTLSREDVGATIAGELGLPVDGRRADEVVRMLQHDLISKHAAGQQAVLLVEEAQAMPLDTLEEIRLFSNLETARHKLLQIVLFGQPELDDNLNLPRMRQLKERIIHSFTVPPLAPTQLSDFLMFRMRAAGYRGPDVFSRSAMKQIASVSEGIARRVSILADKALLAAFADNTHGVVARHVKAATRDSQFTATAARRSRRLWAAGAVSLVLICSALLVWVWSSSRPAAVLPGAPQFAPQQAPRNAPPRFPAGAVASAPSPALPLQASRVWLQGQPPAHFTLQLALGDSDPVKLARQLRKLDEELGAKHIHLFPTRVGNEIRFGILFGSFSNRAEALAMRQQVSLEWSYRPQLRTFSGVMEEVRRSGGEGLWPK